MPTPRAPAIPWRLEADLRIRLGPRELHLVLDSDALAIGLAGPSGAGKSTLLRVVAGLERRARGRLAVGGEVWQDVGTFVPPWRRHAGWVPQEALLFPHLDVRANLAYAGATAADVEATAAWLGVAALLDRAPRHLSGGERQRVALGRALLSRPRLLLLDEPFSALDKALRVRLAAELAERCRAAGLPLLVVSHDEADLAALAGSRWELREDALRPLG